MNEDILKEKQEVVNEISAKINDAQSVVLFEYHGLSVTKFEELRTQLREEGVEVKIYKNRLTKIAVEKSGYNDLAESLVGPNAIAFSNEDSVAPARIISKFAKKNEAVKIKNGIVENAVVSSEVMAELAQLPSREGLLSMLLSCLQAPMRDTAMIIDAVAVKMEETGAATAKEIIVEKAVEEAQPVEEAPEN